MLQFLTALFMIIKEIGSENGLLLISILAFATICFSLYVALTAIKALSLKKNNE